MVDGDLRAIVRRRRCGDDACRRARLEPVQKEGREQKGRQVVYRPGPLDTVCCELATRVNGACVVNEHVGTRVAFQNLAGDAAYIALRGKIGSKDVDVRSNARRGLGAALKATDDDG